MIAFIRADERSFISLVKLGIKTGAQTSLAEKFLVVFLKPYPVVRLLKIIIATAVKIMV